MLKKFLKSKVFVLSMLAVSIGNDAIGMNPLDPSGGNNGASFSDCEEFFLNDDTYDYNFDGDNFFNVFEDQGNNEQPQDTNAVTQASTVTTPINQPIAVRNPRYYPPNNDFLGIGDDQGNNEQPQDTNAVTQASAVATPINQPIAVRNPRYYPPNWYSSGAGQFFDKHLEYNKCFDQLYHFYAQLLKVGMPKYILTINKSDDTSEVRKKIADNWNGIAAYADLVIQTNPQTNRGIRALYPDGWEGSDAGNFCVNYGLNGKNEIRLFVTNMRRLGYQVPAIPRDAVEGRRVFMDKVYPVLAMLPEEEIQGIKNYKNELLSGWNDSSIGQYCNRNEIRSKELLLKLYDLVSKKIDLPKMNRNDQRSKPLILKRILSNEQTIVQILQENPDILQQLQQNQ